MWRWISAMLVTSVAGANLEASQQVACRGATPCVADMVVSYGFLTWGYPQTPQIIHL